MKLRPLTKISLLALTALVVLTFAGGVYLYRWWHAPLTLSATGTEYTLSAGSSLSRAAYDLHQKGILEHPRAFTLTARVFHKVKVKAGEYRFDVGDTPATLLEKLNNGDVITYKVTLVEGRTFHEALMHLQRQEKITTTLNSPGAIAQFVHSLDLKNDHPEGWFFPDTYRYVAGTTDADILKQAYSKMRDVLATEWETRADYLPYNDSYEALIMASIVERETGLASERQQIAGVFVRRLQKHMRLQTDPTVIYGLGENYQGNIRREHLSQLTPYNTYMIVGLPPTPIALPGKDAIHAALHPDDGDALYFVAKGDGSHYFSATLEEHNQAVRRYQVTQRARDYQSTPKRANNETGAGP